MNFDFPKLHSHELVLFFYPSPGLDWTSPRTLVLTTLRNKLLGRARGIGHVAIFVRTPTASILTGMTQLNANEGRREVLFGGYGLGILLHNFRGALESEAKLIPELETLSRRPGRLSYLRVLAHERTTARLFDYFREYRARNCDRFYGMRNRPRYGEGGGCSAFATSFLEVADVLDEDLRGAWTRSFRIPKSAIGGPGTPKKISVLELIRKSARWAREDEAHEPGFFWDPDLMHAWVTRSHGSASMAPDRTAEMWNSARGITLDARTRPAPDEPIFRMSPEAVRTD